VADASLVVVIELNLLSREHRSISVTINDYMIFGGELKLDAIIPIAKAILDTVDVVLK
jgi:phosphopantothenate synthetase